MVSIASAASEVGGQIGRHFGAVAMLPGLVATAWTGFLLAAGATGPSFDAARGLQVAGEIATNLSHVATLISISVLVGLVLNPFQFAATQLLEGYWGRSRLGIRLAALRINANRRRFRAWQSRVRQAEESLSMSAAAIITDSGEQPPDDLDQLLDRAREILGTRKGDSLVADSLVIAHDPRERRKLPAPSRTMPTRLGNVLRAFEDRAGVQYGLDAITVAPRLALLDANRRTAYVSDARRAMDLSIRFCLMYVLLTPLTLVLLADDGWWILLGLAAYGLAYGAYRGAISEASAYGNAVSFQIDLDRFSLYSALCVPVPTDTVAERAQNIAMIEVLNGGDGFLRYDPPSQAT